MTVLKKPSYIMEDILGGENPLVMILEAVSYTHLDVYKRQRRHCAAFIIYVILKYKANVRG